LLLAATVRSFAHTPLKLFRLQQYKVRLHQWNVDRAKEMSLLTAEMKRLI